MTLTQKYSSLQENSMTWVSVEVDDGLIVFLWSRVLLVVHAKHNRAEVLDSNISGASLHARFTSQITEFNRRGTSANLKFRDVVPTICGKVEFL